jgi:YegS/Rv2252/BmrU family lipid kinase
LGSLLVDIKFPGSWDESRELSRKFAVEGADSVVVVGGDGTLNAVANGLVGTECKLAVVPCGTANDMARFNRIPKHLEIICDMVRNGSAKRVDMISVNGWHFLTTGGLGFPANIVQRINRWRSGSRVHRAALQVLGKYSYAVGTLREFFDTDPEGYQMNIQWGKKQISGRFHLLMISNQPTTARIFRIAPGADNTDGKLDIFIAAATGSVCRFAETVTRTLGGRHTDRSDSVLFQSDRLSIEVETSLDFFGDGELKVRDTEFNVKVIPAGLRLICSRTIPHQVAS